MTRSARGLAGVVLAVAVAAVCVRLGFWQLSRLSERRAANAVRAARAELPPVPLDSLLGRGALDAAAARVLEFRAAIARGRYDGSHHVLLRGRADEGTPGVEVVTPLVIGGARSAVLVDRGWVPAPDGETPDPRLYAVRGDASIEGRAEPLPSGAGRTPVALRATSAALVVSRLDRAALSARLPYAIAPLVIRLMPAGADARTWPRPLPPPPPSDGPHLSYAIQWFAFAAVTLVGTAVLALSRRAPRVPPRA